MRVSCGKQRNESIILAKFRRRSVSRVQCRRDGVRAPIEISLMPQGLLGDPLPLSLLLFLSSAAEQPSSWLVVRLQARMAGGITSSPRYVFQLLLPCFLPMIVVKADHARALNPVAGGS